VSTDYESISDVAAALRELGAESPSYNMARTLGGLADALENMESKSAGQVAAVLDEMAAGLDELMKSPDPEDNRDGEIVGHWLRRIRVASAKEYQSKGRGVVRYMLLDRLNRNANQHSAADDTIERLHALALEYESDAPQYAPYRICAVVEMKETEHQSVAPKVPAAEGVNAPRELWVSVDMSTGEAMGLQRSQIERIYNCEPVRYVPSQDTECKSIAVPISDLVLVLDEFETDSEENPSWGAYERLVAIIGGEAVPKATECRSVFSGDDLRRILDWHEEVRTTCGISAADDNLRKRIVGVLRDTDCGSNTGKDSGR
jgi:hypothetical protein